jgi:thioredoxin 1
MEVRLKEISNEQFQDAISKGTVLVDFSAEWCGPCKAMMPVLQRVSSEYGDRLDIYTVDIDKQPELAAKHGVMSVPTFLIYHDGRQVDRMVGAVSEKDLKKKFEAYVGV